MNDAEDGQEVFQGDGRGDPQVVLGIDLGTGGPKVALIDQHGEVLGHEVESNDLILTDDGGVEQDPDQWWDSIVRATRRLLKRDLVPIENITLVSVTAQMMTTVPVDRKGRHLHNAISWLDSRGAAETQRVMAGPVSVKGYEVRKATEWLRYTSGIPSLSGRDPVGHILWLKKHHPKVYADTHLFLEAADYLTLRLTGQAVSNPVSICGHWLTDVRDMANAKYVPSLFAHLGLNPSQFPELRPTVSVVGPIAPAAATVLGLGRHVEVVAPLPDNVSAALGAGSIDPADAHLYVGTSSWVSAHTPTKKVDALHQVTTLPSAVDDFYLIGAEQESAGNCLAHLVNNIIFPDDGLTGERPDDAVEKVMALAATSPAGAHGLRYLPWLSGERTPVDDHDVRGGFVNMGLATDRADMVRAVLEGVAFNTRWMFEYVERFAGDPFRSVTFIGGGAQGPLWAQIMSDVLNRPIRRAKDPRMANVRGAAFHALVTKGHLTWAEVPAMVMITENHEPNPDNRDLYDDAYRGFRKNYKLARRIA